MNARTEHSAFRVYYESRGKISRPKDWGYVDDKNCLAELTVVLKLNQGAGNGCKSLPVCFSLALSFAQAKESA